jgi:hypothetical protein
MVDRQDVFSAFSANAFDPPPPEPGIGNADTESAGAGAASLLAYNGPAHTLNPFSGNQDIDAALIGSRWNSFNLTYSFPTAANQYQAGYGTVGEPGFATNPSGFIAFNAAQQAAANYALGLIFSYTLLSFQQITETTTTHATIRFAQTSDTNLGSAHAWFPSNLVQSGDVWFGTSTNQPFYLTPAVGNWGQATVMHELGHAMGLKHGHQDYTFDDLRSFLDPSGANPRYGSQELPANHDGQSWSLMTYRSDPGAPVVFQGDGFNQPQTYMQDDIAALQFMYGAWYGYNSGNTVYSFSTTTGQMFIDGVGQPAPTGNIIYRTIWDGGGNDTYNLNNYTTNLSIDLTPGAFSNFGMQLANNRPLTGPTVFAPGNIANALLYQGNTASLIENAIGGSGNDTFIGNVANNGLNGYLGFDTVVFAGNMNQFNFVEGNAHNYTVTGNSQGTDTLFSIERFRFNDITVTDDVIGGVSTTNGVAVGGAAAGNTQFFGDRDWFATTLAAGHNYLIHERGSPTGAGTLTDSYVRLHNSAGTEVAANDDGGFGFDSELAVHVGTNGTYYVDAGGFNDFRTGTYTVDVQDLGTASIRFQDPSITLPAFGVVAGGWSSQDTYPRELADVNGDQVADIVGFGSAGVYVSLATGGGNFAAPTFELGNFGAGAGGWSSDNTYPREVADVNGDFRADIIGFSQGGVFVSLATGNGHFAAPTFELGSFGTVAGGWSSQDLYPREVADVNGDNRDDIIGFSQAGVFVSLATAGGHFAAPTFELGSFGTVAGGWSSQNLYPRAVADVNGDNQADIIGFSQAGVFVSLATAGGHFAAPTFELGNFGSGAGGWSSQDLYPREVADVNADNRADIIGFSSAGVYVSLATGGGHFAAPTSDLAAYGAGGPAGNWTSDNLVPRQLADVTGDGRADIVGFSYSGVSVSPSHDFLLV